MSDPFERLRNPDVSSVVPDVAALKARARRIERRRQTVLGAGAMTVAIVAVIGVALGTGGEPTQLAEGQRSKATPAATLAPLAAEQAESTPIAREQTAAATVGGPSADRAAAPETGETATSSGAALAGAPELHATIEVKEASLTRATQLTLKVCNQSPDVVKRTFGTSQRYDFEVKRGSDVVWRWSGGRMFTQVVGQETWKLNECKTWTEEWNGVTSSGALAAQGEYQAIGVLKTSPELKSKATSFCFGSC
jgi:hypothetical protein